MRKKVYNISLCIIMLAIGSPLCAQLKTQGVAFGAGAGANLGDTDIGRDDKPGYHGQVFFRHSIFGPFEGQLGGSLQGKIFRDDADAYETKISTADYRLLLRPFALSVFSPYLYAGAGGLYYDVTIAPANADPAIETTDWVPFAPVGGGLQFKIVDGLSLDISGGYNFAFSDNLNLLTGGRDDGYYSGAVSLTFTGASGNSDTDKDGLTNKEEEKFGTDKKRADTDYDGLTDGEELLRYKTHPLKPDTDGDGLEDKDEIIFYNTNPRNPDSDGDGLSDYEEVNTYKTNPMRKDSDDDRLSDGDEVRISKTNPLKADSDDDGLTDGEELVTYKTDPFKQDTDGDGLMDGKEVNIHTTDPSRADTDNDRLTDGEEINQYQTDPNNPDTDGGGALDGEEVVKGTDPNNPADDNKDLLAVQDVGDKVLLDGIIFSSGSATISTQSRLILDKAYNTLIAYPEMEVEIHGYTDSQGGYDLNMRLSQRRADAVRAYLIQLGIASGRISSRGFGEDNPIATNNTSEGRALNRRIEFIRSK